MSSSEHSNPSSSFSAMSQTNKNANTTSAPEASNSTQPEVLKNARVSRQSIPTINFINEKMNSLKPKLLLFWKKDPELGFALMESFFAVTQIIKDSTKYRYTIANLEPTLMQFVSDVVKNPPVTNKYETLKRRIITSFKEMNKLKTLLQEYEFKDEKPSLFLERLKYLAKEQCTDVVLRTLFLEHFPENIRAILDISETKDLAKLALQADQITEITKTNIWQINNSANLDKKDGGKNMLQQGPSYNSKFWEAIEAITRPINEFKIQYQDSRAKNELKEQYQYQQKVKMNLFVKCITDVYDLVATEPIYAISEEMVKALQEFVDLEESEEIWKRKLIWSTNPCSFLQPYPLYSKILFLLTGDTKYKCDNTRWPIPPPNNRNVFQELYVREKEQRLLCKENYQLFNRLSIWEKLYEDFSVGRTKLKGISLSKYSEANSPILTSTSEDEEEFESDDEEITVEERVTAFSRSKPIFISFPFLTTIKSNTLFCTILSEDTLCYIMHSKCTGKKAKMINNMIFREAWNYADKYYFYPWVLERIEHYEREKLVQPIHLEIATEIVGELQAHMQRPNTKAEAKKLDQLLKLVELLSLKILILQNKLQFLEIAPSATSPIASTSALPIAITQRRDKDFPIKIKPGERYTYNFWRN